MEGNETIKDVINNFINKRTEKFQHNNNSEGSDEICIEPFAFTDENANVIDFVQLEDYEEVKEIEDYEEVKEIDDIEEKVKEVAEQIKPISDLILEANMGEKILVNKLNCNINYVPIINLYLITNLDITIVQFLLTDAMEEIRDVMLNLLIKMEDKYILCEMTLGTLDDLGLIYVHYGLDDLELSNVEFRGLTTKLDFEELETLFKDYDIEETSTDCLIN